MSFPASSVLPLLCHSVIASLSLCLSGLALDAHWSRGGCSSGRSVLTVLGLPLSTDEFNNPVHFAVDSEGGAVAAAGAAPANAGRVTSAPLCRDCSVELTAGTLSRALGDLFVTSSRFGLIQNDSTRLD